MSSYADKDRILSQLQSSEYWGESTKCDKKYITNLICPECGKPEAYTYVDRPHKIYCNRRNKCGAIVDVADIVPNITVVFEKEYPATIEDRNRPATAYLQSRGLNRALKGLDYQYWPNVRNTGCGAVMFLVKSPSGKTVFNGRLLNPPDGKGKTHNRGSTSGCLWRHPDLTYDSAQKTYLTEGIMDALSFIEVGQQAVAILSSGQDPSKVDLQEFDKIVLAFDNDPAGRKALRRFNKYFAQLKGDEKKEVESILPINGDWNDLLQSGDLESSRFKSRRNEYVTEAMLACAARPKEYARILYQRRYKVGLFEFNGQYYFSRHNSDTNEDVFCYRVSDFTLRIKYYQLDRTNPHEPIYRYYLEVRSKSGRISTFISTSQDISNPHALRAMFLQRACSSWTGGKDESNELVEQILRAKVPTVRQVDKTGYDLESKGYIFKNHMVDPQGNFIRPDKNGFLRVGVNQYVRPPYHNTLCPSKNSNVSFMIDQLIQAWGDKALVTLAWLVASWFVNQIKDQIGFFPFLSLYGDTQTGKSNLTKIMNHFQCHDEEGIPMNKTNTAKGEMRKLAQKSGIASVFLEWTPEGSGRHFNSDVILPLYNINPLQLRAVKSTDLRTDETPFLGALMFVQNIEPFKTKAQRERVISLQFKAEDLNETTGEGFNALDRIPADEKAWLFAEVMQQRLFFESNWNHYYENAKSDLAKPDLTSRIVETHGLILGFYRMLAEVLRIDYDLHSYMLDIANKKQVLCSERQITAADEFFDIIQNLDSEAVRDFMEIKDGILWIQKPDAEKYLKEQNYLSNWHNSALMDSLKNHPGLVYTNRAKRFNGSTRKMWGFDLRKMDFGVKNEVTQVA